MTDELCALGGPAVKLFAKLESLLPIRLFDDLPEMLVRELCVRGVEAVETRVLVFVSIDGGLRVGDRDMVGPVDDVELEDRMEKKDLERDVLGLDCMVTICSAGRGWVCGW